MTPSKFPSHTHAVVEKHVGETPLQALEHYRSSRPGLEHVPLAYAGRLDPMASGKLLILIGDECKNQRKYHGLDKEYEFEVLLGAQSDTGDVLGIVTACNVPKLREADLQCVAGKLVGSLTLPYPHFSSRTVAGKPLHTWTLEKRLGEIEIPTYTATIHALKLIERHGISADELYAHVSKKIETIPKVTDERKALGNDFRRPEVRTTWKAFYEAHTSETYTIAKFSCISSAGTYMRTLAQVLAQELGTCGLAYSIHRTQIGTYRPLPFGFGYWRRRY